ncbi:SusC/RagA family TonB-linked outer membrane protein [Hymenobacter latericus]|uniref:SusC/RagA family TonB-linked outer membrane protein n=1 Tax=Hymenobacter sp. YIM 151858-1 TaxID=2987688 RepID=UPI00222651BE|nr:TonB-dependent receptor [Hymenobacter sp. YIM 151858-1]UYZ59227.1 TonB-dependent receptor [Hymenobacter sp. YIM 151858-1]
MNKLLLGLIPLVAFAHQSVAQDRSVSGRITDRATGEGIPGATVLLKGTTTGVSTNSDGTFTLSAPAAGGTLVISSVGYVSIERALGSENQVNIGLAADNKQLSEVVVTGYGTQERRDVTGSIASVKGEEIANLPTPSFDQQLAGRAAGVQATVPSGLLGATPRIRIRGTNTITSGAQPLVVVDGVPIITGNQSGVVQNNPLADINPSDIESYEVLKDGSATAIYGSRGANGVILITTKRGRLGKAKVSYDNWFGWAQTVKRYEVLNADQFIEINNERLRNNNSPAQAFPFEQDGQRVSTDWQDEIFRTGFQQNHALSVSGATEKTNYFFSAGYTDQNAVIKANSLQRITFRTNLDQEVLKWLRVGMNLGLTRTNTDGLNTSVNGLSGNVTNALSLFPNVPARNPDGTPYISTSNPAVVGQGNNTLGIAFNYPNIIFPLENNVYRATNYRVLGNTYLEAEPLKGLRLRSQLGTDVFLNDDFQYNDPRHGDGRGPNGIIYQQSSPTTRWNWQNTINYDKLIADQHKLGVVVGSELQKTKAQFFWSQATGLSDRFFGPNSLISNTFATPTVGGGYVERGFSSVFGRLNYGFKDRYLFSASLRYDGISDLPEANRYGLFPGGSVGWRISEEPFFKNLNLGFISDFKARASYAVVGNVDFGAFAYASLFGPGKYGSQNGIGYNRDGQFGNDQLKWEQSKKKDIGVDLGFLDNRITVGADYYINDNSDLILSVPVAVSLGIPNYSYRANVGDLESKGFEFTFNSQNIQNEAFTWTTNFNFATNKAIVKSLGGSGDILATYNITRVGEVIGALYGYDFQGVNSANGYPIYRKGDGSLVQANVDNNSYYAYDPANPGAALGQAVTPLQANVDRKILGNPNPTWFGGITNSFTFKGFDASVFVRFSGGNKIMNVTRQQLLRQEFLNNGTEILDRWTTPGQQTNVPKQRYNNSDFINLNNSAVSRFVEDGDFVRIQNISLGYTLPQNLLGFTGLSRIRVYGQVQNAFTFTKYKGVDPEVNSSGNSNLQQNTQFGIDNNSNPQQRVFTTGLNVSF